MLIAIFAWAAFLHANSRHRAPAACASGCTRKCRWNRGLPAECRCRRTFPSSAGRRNGAREGEPRDRDLQIGAEESSDMALTLCFIGGGENGALDGRFHQLDLVGVLAERLGTFGGRFARLRRPTHRPAYLPLSSAAASGTRQGIGATWPSTISGLASPLPPKATDAATSGQSSPCRCRTSYVAFDMPRTGIEMRVITSLAASTFSRSSAVFGNAEEIGHRHLSRFRIRTGNFKRCAQSDRAAAPTPMD